MAAKLIQYWNIARGRKEEFDIFFREQFIPAIDESGHMKMVGSWLVASGEGPAFVAEGLAKTVEDMATLIMGSTFIELRKELLKLVDDYSTKLLVPTERLAEQPIEIQKGYKFNRHFNINAEDYYGFYAFMEKEYFPMMAAFNLQMVGDWYVEVGATPYVISESRADDLHLISKMIQSRENQVLTLKLLTMATNYGCKVLIPSGHL
jgi:hypothetical protein